MGSESKRKGAHENLCLPRSQIEDLFWRNVDKQGPDACWAWRGPVGPSGLGRLAIRGANRRGQTLTARRLAVWFSGRTLPPGTVFVRCTCANPSCVNPKHLRLGNVFCVSKKPPYLSFDDLKQRFWSKKITQEANGCMLWRASSNEQGYGKLIVSDMDGKSRVLFAHKVAVYLATKKWPAAGQSVCHHCDTPSCVNIDHLYVGSPATNGRDAALRKRLVRPHVVALRQANVARGAWKTERFYAARKKTRLLTKDQAIAILTWHANIYATRNAGKPKCGCRWTQDKIREHLQCGENTVHRAVRRLVDESKPETKRRNDHIRSLYFGPDGHAKCIKQGKRTGSVTLKDISREYGVSADVINCVIAGITFAELEHLRFRPRSNHT
jgi:hypothetical protein